MARAAHSLNVLLAQLNAKAPRRSKASDGWIGDASHMSRDSDHNAWYGPGIVTARDFTHDSGGGLDCQWLANTLVAHRDPRIKYVIWSRRIWTPSAGWRPYSGANAHTSHLHLSVVAAPACDSTAAWAAISPVTPTPQEDNVELTDKIKFWDGFEITVGQALGETWQLANGLADRPTRPDQPADPPQWLKQLFNELAAMRGELTSVRAEVAELKARPAADVDEAELAAELDARGIGGVSAAELKDIIAKVRLVPAPDGNPA